MSGRLIKRSDGWEVDLAGLAVTDTSIDRAFVIVLWDGDDQWEARIEGAFAWTADGRPPVRYEPDTGLEVGAVPQVVGSVVSHLWVTASGELQIQFEDGSRIEVDVDDRYEAWQITGPDRILIVGMPGGQVAVWNADDTPDANLPPS